MQSTEMASLSNSKYQNRKERPKQRRYGLKSLNVTLSVSESVNGTLVREKLSFYYGWIRPIVAKLFENREIGKKDEKR